MGILVKNSYDAFISYRHSELDSFVASELQKALERFKLPKNMAKSMPKNKIERVFRDSTELPLASNLSEPITEALSNSAFLIVICTPRLRESIWCQKEIETFINMHGRERVLAVLAEGEPSESFPEQLTKAIQYYYAADGSTQAYYVDVEPMAADVRGLSQKEIKKKINEEVVRIAAPMFGCAYDDIKQRHREEKLKRTIAKVSIASGIMLAFGCVSAVMALRIATQSKTIENQLQEIQEQYDANLSFQSEIMLNSANNMLENGNYSEAANMASMAVLENKDSKENDRAAYILAETLRVYDDGSILKPAGKIALDAGIDTFMPIGNKRVLVCDCQNTISIWDMSTMSKVKTIYYNSVDILQREALCIDLDYNIYYMDDEKIHCLDSQSYEEKWSCENKKYERIAIALNSKKLFAVSANKIVCFNAENGEIEKTHKIESKYNDGYISNFFVDAEEKNVFVVYDQKGGLEYDDVASNSDASVSDTYGATIYRVDADTMKKNNLLELVNEQIIYAEYDKNNDLLLLTNYSVGESTDYGTNISDKKLVCVKCSTFEKLWETQIDIRVSDFCVTSTGNVVCVSSFDIEKRSVKSGKLIAKQVIPNIIVGLYALGDGRVEVITESGDIFFENNRDEFDFYLNKKNFPGLGGNTEYVYIADGYFIKLNQYTKEVNLFNMEVSSKLTKEAGDCKYPELIFRSFETDESINEGSSYKAYLDKKVGTLSITDDTGTKRGEYECRAAYIKNLLFDDDYNNLFVVYLDDKIEVLDAKTVQLKNTITVNEYITSYCKLNDDYYLLSDYETGFIVKANTNVVVATIPYFASYDAQSNTIYIKNDEDIYSVPFYSLEELLELNKAR